VEGLEALDVGVETALADILASGPTAVRAAKAIVREVRGLGHGSSKWHTARVIARQRTSPEAQEGFAAFTTKRKPGWDPDAGG
jgi:methylglutaconyl-CoA hydratase